MTSANKSLEKKIFHQVENVIKQLVHTSAVRSSRYEARGKFGEHERCTRVARGYALLFRIFCALQTSCVLHISMNARWRMNQLLSKNQQIGTLLCIGIFGQEGRLIYILIDILSSTLFFIIRVTLWTIADTTSILSPLHLSCTGVNLGKNVALVIKKLDHCIYKRDESEFNKHRYKSRLQVSDL